MGAVGWIGARGGTRLNPATNGVGGRVGEGHANEAAATTKRAERDMGVLHEERKLERLLRLNTECSRVKKLTAPQGLPRQSPTLVLTRP